MADEELQGKRYERKEMLKDPPLEKIPIPGIILDLEASGDTGSADTSLDASDIQPDSARSKSSSVGEESESYHTAGRVTSDVKSLTSSKTVDEYKSCAHSDISLASSKMNDDTLKDVQFDDSSSENQSVCVDANGNEPRSLPNHGNLPLNSSPVPLTTSHQSTPIKPAEKDAKARHVSSDDKPNAEMESSVSTDSEITELEEEEGLETDLEDNVENDDDDIYGVVFSHATREQNPTLPSTVTKLETTDGGKVYLVGTAHFSLESQDDVAKTIRATQPDIVMVELCKGRVNILQLDEKTILEEAKNMNLEKIRSAIKQSGLVQGVMYLLLLSMSAHLTKQLGMAPGGEFRRAFAEAKKVPGCLIHLGDRPIQITLQRALAALSLWQKLRLAWYMITCKEPISKEEVERCKQRDLLEELLAEMTGEFPALSEVFVKERDTYLTHSLQLAASSVAGNQAKHGAAATPAVIVGVVGIGHVPGIVENWGKVSENDIPVLLKIPEASLSGKILRYSLKASLLGLVAWGCYRTIPFHKLSRMVSNLSLFQPVTQAS